MPPIALDKPRYRIASTVLAATGLAILLAVLVMAVVDVSDDSTKPVVTPTASVRPGAGSAAYLGDVRAVCGAISAINDPCGLIVARRWATNTPP
jgi:hypothetical protein